MSLRFFKTSRRNDESCQEIQVYRPCPSFYIWNHSREPRFRFPRVWEWWEISKGAHASVDRKPSQGPDRHPRRYNLDAIIWCHFGTDCQFKITPQPVEKCIIPQDHQSRWSSDKGGNFTEGLWFQQQVSLVHRNSVKPKGFLVDEVAKEIGGHEDTNRAQRQPPRVCWNMWTSTKYNGKNRKQTREDRGCNGQIQIQLVADCKSFQSCRAWPRVANEEINLWNLKGPVGTRTAGDLPIQSQNHVHQIGRNMPSIGPFEELGGRRYHECRSATAMLPKVNRNVVKLACLSSGSTWFQPLQMFVNWETYQKRIYEINKKMINHQHLPCFCEIWEIGFCHLKALRFVGPKKEPGHLWLHGSLHMFVLWNLRTSENGKHSTRTIVIKHVCFSIWDE